MHAKNHKESCQEENRQDVDTEENVGKHGWARLASFLEVYDFLVVSQEFLNGKYTRESN